MEMPSPRFCPFCNEHMPYVVRREAMCTKGWVMFCGTCGASGPFALTPMKAEELWNRRPPQ